MPSRYFKCCFCPKKSLKTGVLLQRFRVLLRTLGILCRDLGFCFEL